MLKIEKCFRIVTTIVFIIACFIIPMSLFGVLITLYFNALDTIDWLVKLLKCGFKILYGINFLLALIVLVWHIVKTKKAYLMLASSLVILVTVLATLTGDFILFFWPMYLMAFVLIHSAAKDTSHSTYLG